MGHGYLLSIRCHATSGAEATMTKVIVKAKGKDATALGPAHGCGAVLHLARLLTKGEGGSSIQLGALAEPVHTTFTCILMLFGVHAQIVLGETTGSMRFEEAAVTTIKDIDLGERQLGIAEYVLLAVLLANSLGPGQRIRIAW